VLAALDALVIALYVEIDDFLEPRRGAGRPPRLSDAELITLAVAQVFLGLPNDRQFLALARYRLGHLFPVLIDQSGYNRRLRALAPQIARAINYLAFISPSFCDNLRLLDSTPVPCGQSRETVRRSEFAGHAGYGYCPSKSLFVWGMRLVLMADIKGTPVGYDLVGPKTGQERESVPLAGHVVIADKGFAGADFEHWIANRGAHFLRPDRKDEPHRHGSLGQVRQWIESVFWTCKGQLGLERHGARTLPGLAARIALRLLALAAGIWHNHNTGQPARTLAAYGR
jgi:hypothetical protein